MPDQKLVIICGSPCVGKTTVAEKLFYSYENSAFFDDDWAWRVNPFIMDDPRHKSCYKSMSFVLSNYLNNHFDYVIFSSVRMMYPANRESVLNDISAKDMITIGFTLTCSEETLAERFKNRGDEGEVSFEWLRMAPHPNDHVIHTDHKTVEEIVEEMRREIYV